MKKYISHAFHIFNGTSAIYLVGLLTNIYVARILGPEAFGMLVIGVSVLSYAVLFSDIGLRQLGLLETSKTDEKRDFSYGEIFFIRGIQGLAVFFLSQIFVFLFYHERTLQIVISFYLLGILCDAFFLDWFYRGLQKFKLISYIRIASSIIYLALILILIKSEKDLILVPILYTIQMLIPVLILLLRIKTTPFKLVFPVSLSRFFLILRQGIYIGLSQILNQIHVLLPPIIIGKMISSQASGYYGAAFKILISANILDIVLINIFLTSFYKMWHNNRENCERNVQTVLNFALALGFGVSLFITIASPLIINTIFGIEFDNSIKLLSISSWFISLTLLNSIFLLIFVSLGNKRIFLLLNFTGALISTFILMVLIINYKTTGAAFALVLSELVFVFIFFKASTKYCNLNFFVPLIKTATISTLSFILFTTISSNIFISVSITMIIFFAASLLLGIISPSDINLLRMKWENS